MQLQLEEVMDFSHSSYTSQLHIEEKMIASKSQLQLEQELMVSKSTNFISLTNSNPVNSITLPRNDDLTQVHIHSSWPFNYVYER
jgi:hypothetical protein